jgi:hypothetical protein
MKKLICGVFALASLSACSNDISWNEESKQADGSMLLLSRSIKLGGGHEIGQSTPIASESISFTDTKTGNKIAWHSPSNPYFLADPVLFQFDGKIVWVLVNPRSCGAWQRYGRPNPAFILFKIENGQQQQLKADELPEPFRYMNILFWPKDEYNLQQINEMNSILSWNEIVRLNQRFLKKGASKALMDIDYSKYNMKGCGE